MSFKSFHLANSRSLLVIMEKTPRGTGYSGLALLPPLKAWDSEVTWGSWGESVLYSYDAAIYLQYGNTLQTTIYSGKHTCTEKLSLSPQWTSQK